MTTEYGDGSKFSLIVLLSSKAEDHRIHPKSDKKSVFVTSKDEFSNSPIHEFKAKQRFKTPF